LQTKIQQAAAETNKWSKQSKANEIRLIDVRQTIKQAEDKWAKEKATLEERLKQWEHRAEDYRIRVEGYDAKNLDDMDLMKGNTKLQEKFKLISRGCTILRKENEAFKKEIDQMKKDHRHELSKFKYDAPEAFKAELREPGVNSSQIPQLEANLQILAESNTEAQEQASTLQDQVCRLQAALWQNQIKSPPSY